MPVSATSSSLKHCTHSPLVVWATRQMSTLQKRALWQYVLCYYHRGLATPMPGWWTSSNPSNQCKRSACVCNFKQPLIAHKGAGPLDRHQFLRAGPPLLCALLPPQGASAAPLTLHLFAVCRAIGQTSVPSSKTRSR